MERAAETIDAQAATLREREAEIERLRVENKQQRMSIEIAVAKVDELQYYKSQTKALDDAKAKEQNLIAENAALRERCAAAEATLSGFKQLDDDPYWHPTFYDPDSGGSAGRYYFYDPDGGPQLMHNAAKI